MKKIILSFLLVFSSGIFAYNNPVIVKIINSTGNDCVLDKEIIINGYLASPSFLPGVILKDQSITFKIKSHKDKRKSILLTYSCGEERSATFFTDITPFTGMLVSDGYKIKANKIAMYFSEDHNKTGEISDKSPIQVHWRLVRD